jgi:hypothetical protein
MKVEIAVEVEQAGADVAGEEGQQAGLFGAFIGLITGSAAEEDAVRADVTQIEAQLVAEALNSLETKLAQAEHRVTGAEQRVAEAERRLSAHDYTISHGFARQSKGREIDKSRPSFGWEAIAAQVSAAEPPVASETCVPPNAETYINIPIENTDLWSCAPCPSVSPRSRMDTFLGLITGSIAAEAAARETAEQANVQARAQLVRSMEVRVAESERRAVDAEARAAELERRAMERRVR